jgi:hypothetical protein
VIVLAHRTLEEHARFTRIKLIRLGCSPAYVKGVSNEILEHEYPHVLSFGRVAWGRLDEDVPIGWMHQ